MVIIVPKEMAKMIKEAVIKAGDRETKGALFARRVSDNCFEIEDIFISKIKGTTSFSKLVVNFSYKRHEKKYFKRNKNDYENHNYIGDWHSHPSYSCNPSSYDIEEVFDELRSSNANFLIQMIVKMNDESLIGNCFFYKLPDYKEKCELIIQSCD